MKQREMKFRAWDEATSKMVFTGFHIIGEVTMFSAIEQYCYETKGESNTLDRINDIIITQYTGAKDFNGNDIYEGDVVRGESGRLYEIKWREDELQWSIFSKDTYYPIYGNFTVIGNIFVDPDLIK